MTVATLTTRPAGDAPAALRLEAMIALLRQIVLAPGGEWERCHALFLDAQRCFRGDASIGLGGVSTLTLRLREVMAEALRLDAYGMILAHNHPSGDCRPSRCDIAATQRLAQVARALDIELIDHLIFTDNEIYSMRAGGLL